MLVTLRSAPRSAEPQAYMCGKKINKLEKGMSLVTVKGKYGCRKSLVAFAPGARLRISSRPLKTGCGTTK